MPEIQFDSLVNALSSIVATAFDAGAPVKIINTYKKEEDWKMAQNETVYA